MFYHITYGEFQYNLKKYYLSNGEFCSFGKMARNLDKKSLFNLSPNSYKFPKLHENISNEEFEKYFSNFTLISIPKLEILDNNEKYELDIFPLFRDVFAICHLRYLDPSLHSHNYFEINYVIKGKCNFLFENTTKIMNEGEICIIGPNSKHNICIDDDSIVFTLLIRKSTFETTFFSLLSQKNLLSYFFLTILKDSSTPNYLLFSTEDDCKLKDIMRNIIVECNTIDDYSNNCCISLVNLFFSLLLRNYSKTMQFNNYNVYVDFSLILQYIQHNYKTLTLSSLASYFHYNECYLSTIIKQNTSHSFTDLIKKLRMADAEVYLKNTNLKISEIAEKTGYKSADHFSRVFKSTYNTSPQNYRKHYVDKFV